ncbi:multicopper oxidase family protein [Schinkia sp. CFF1]
MKLKLTVLLASTILALSACSSNDNGEVTSKKDDKAIQTTAESNSNGGASTNFETLTGNEFTLVAKKAPLQLNSNLSVEAWTFNGTVPGSQIRVKEGEKVTIHFKNELPEPASIHWHGIAVPNAMDGIPGVTQDAVKPGETFTYEFTATKPGTYMYHTHQNAVNQIDKGLYGSFIVEPKKKTYDRDYTIMLDEWISDPAKANAMNNMGGTDQGSMSGMDHGNMGGMDHSNMGNMDHGASNSQNDMHGSMNMVHDMSMYDLYTMNGKSGDLIEPLKVKEGETVRIRLANIGYLSHKMHLHGHKFKVVAIDGQELNEPKEIKDELIAIAPGERYDIEFVANNPGTWYLEEHGDTVGTEGMRAKIQYEGASDSTDQSNHSEDLPVFSFVNYGGTKNGEFTLNQKYDVEYTMDLNGNNMDNVWTINGKSFPNVDGLKVKEGDLVKVKLMNNSPAGNDHPMHLHGHSFQVLSKNGKPIEGSPVIKDTINVKPGEEYVVAFKANNPGNWLFHCHDLHHATAGMVDLVKYDGYQSNYTPDANASNKPE